MPGVLPCLANNGLPQLITSTMVRSQFQRPQVMDTALITSLVAVKDSSKHWFGPMVKASSTYK